jgi:hypothetical protein
MTRPILRSCLAAALCAAAPLAAVAAQTPESTRRDSTGSDTALASPRIAAAPQPAPRGLDFSGIIFGNFQYHTEAAAATGANKDRFALDRAYLTFRMPAGDRASIRATADVFANGTSGYDFRAKYAYLQYDYLRPTASGASALARVGILHTVVIDHEEGFWPRWIAPVALEKAGLFSSADLGVATQVTLPLKLGDLYAPITNGTGYVNAGPDDRFKDYALRATLTPLAGRTTSLLKSFTISPWFYKGDTASKFGPNSNLGNVPGYAGPIARGIEHDRYGLLVGVRDPRLVVAAHYAERRNELESDSNTVTNPERITDVQTGRVWSAYTLIKPFALERAGSPLAPLGVVLRYDHIQPDRRLDPYTRFVVAGLTWDLNTRVSLAADYQETLPRNGQPVTSPSIAPSKIFFANFVASF